MIGSQLIPRTHKKFLLQRNDTSTRDIKDNFFFYTSSCSKIFKDQNVSPERNLLHTYVQNVLHRWLPVWLYFNFSL